MEEAVVKELKKNLEAINNDMNFLILGKDLPEELIKNGFDGIRILVNYCEKLVLEGESAIEEIV